MNRTQARSLVSKQQRKLDSLHREKKQINQNIKDLCIKLRMLRERSKQHFRQGQSVPTRINDDLPIKTQESVPQHPHLNTQDAGIKQIVDAQASIKERNRRLFGGLTSHLKKASSKLEEQSKKVKQKLILQQKMVQKEREKTLQFQGNQIKGIEESLEKWNSKKTANAKQILQTENFVLKKTFDAYSSDLQNFLFTKVTPSIAWKPAAVQGQLLKKQCQQSLLQTKLKANQTVESITSYNEVFDYSRYISQNEIEYYRNYLQNYLTSKQRFFCTKVKPALMWTPVGMNDKLREVLELSKESLMAESKHIFEENEVGNKRTEQVVMVEEQEAESDSFPE